MDIKKEIKDLNDFVNNNTFTISKSEYYCGKIIDILEELNIQQAVHKERTDIHLSRIQNLEREIGLINRNKPKESPQAKIKPCPFCAWCINQSSCTILKHSETNERIDPLRPHK